MFLKSVPFKEALRCYEIFFLSVKDEGYKFLSDEFCLYAHKKADEGDEDAQKWLEDKPNSHYKRKDEIQSKIDNAIDNHERDKKKKADLKSSENEKDSATEENKSEKSTTDKPDVFSKKTKIESIESDRSYKLSGMTPKQIDKALRPLDKLVGLDAIKKQVREFVLMERHQQKRELAKLPRILDQSRHMVFMGNPGTGKTMVARIIAEIFTTLELTKKSDVTEVERSDLVGPYIGHTETITKGILDKALGGILFIDEAHSLDAGYHWDFGNVAISTILKYMEDHRDNIMVIVAGYPQEMKYFLKMNPGLESRFSTHIHFDDMSHETLLTIFENMMSDHNFVLEDDAHDKLSAEIKRQIKVADKNFGNARMVRNLFEKTLRLQANRIFEKRLSSKKSLSLIKAVDIPSDIKIQKDNVTFL